MAMYPRRLDPRNRHLVIRRRRGRLRIEVPMGAFPFDSLRTISRIYMGGLVVGSLAAVGGACTPEDRDYSSSGGGGAASSSSGEGGTNSSSSSSGVNSSSSSSSSSGNPFKPGEIISTFAYPSGNTLLFDVDVDPSGNTLLAGRYSGTIDFGDGALIDVGGSDIFLARHDSADKLIFSKSYGGPGPAGIIHGAVNAQGNIYATGDISDTSSMSFGGQMLTGPGVWNVALGPSASPLIFDDMISSPLMMGNATPYGVAASANGASVFVGFYNGTISIGPTNLTAVAGTDGYMVKFDPTGQIAWTKSIGGTGHDNMTGIKIGADDNLYTTGYFTETMMFGPNGNSLTSFGGSDIFVAKFGPAGLSKWVRQIGGMGEEFIFGTIAVAPNGDVVVAGNASDPISVEGTMLPAAGGADLFIARYATDGTFRWAKRYGDMGGQYLEALAVDPQGNILVTGPFDGSIDFGSGSLSAPATGAAYLAKLDPTGAPIFARTIGGQLGSIRLAADGLSSVLIAGSGVNVSFDSGSALLPNGGVFWARIAP